MAYSFQTFSVAQILTAAQMNQVEVNIRDHQHGAAGVTGTMTGPIDIADGGILSLRRGAASADFDFYRANTSVTSPTILADNDVVAELVARGYDGAAYFGAAGIRFVVDGTPAAGDMPGRISFATTPRGSSTRVQRWSIGYAGHLTGVIDNTYDIGASASGRPRDLYLAGSLKEGTVPLARMMVQDSNVENGSTVTLTVGSDVTIVASSTLNVLAGDFVYVYGSALLNKGATGGMTALILNKESGTATLLRALPSANDVDIKDAIDQPASTSLYPRQITGIFEILTGGTLVIRLRGYVTGSSTTVTAGDGALYTQVMRGV